MRQHWASGMKWNSFLQHCVPQAGFFCTDTRAILQCQFEASLLRLNESKQKFMGKIKSGAIPCAAQSCCMQEAQPSSPWHSNPEQQLCPRRNVNICSALGRHFSTGITCAWAWYRSSQAGPTKRREKQSPVNPFLNWRQTPLWIQKQWNRALGAENYCQKNKIVLWRKRIFT